MGLTKQELQALSKAYNEHKDEIDEAILSDLHARVPQTEIMETYGLGRGNIHNRAKRAGISYYDTEAKPARRTKKVQHAMQNRLCPDCGLAWGMQDMAWEGTILVCTDCKRKSKKS